MQATPEERGQWSSKLGFVLAAAGSAVGLGNIWKFPSEVAGNGGAVFLLIYIACCFLIGFPVMVAELAMGRRTNKNPVGAFKALGKGPYWLIGLWGITCGVFILSFYLVVAGWTLSYVFAELTKLAALEPAAATLASLAPGWKTAIFTILFMVATVSIVVGGVSAGIERATKTLMPMLIGLLFFLIIYVLFKEGSGEGLAEYLRPELSDVSWEVVLAALGQAFFSLSLGMGALITYGSYLDRKENIPEVGAWVTLSDLGIAFLAGLLIMPTMFVADAAGVAIFNDAGQLVNETTLVFDVMPTLFDSMGGWVGPLFGFAFFLLLSMAALTSTISLLEVPVSCLIDELGLRRRQATIIAGVGIGAVGIVVAMQQGLIGTFATIFSTVGLPLGGLLICLFLAYVWKMGPAMEELESGFPGVRQSLFGKIWPLFMRFLCPLLIAIVFGSTLYQLLS